MTPAAAARRDEEAGVRIAQASRLPSTASLRRRRPAVDIIVAIFALGLALALPERASALGGVAGEAPPPSATATPQHEDFQLPPPPFTEGLFPCSECHKDLKPNPTPRKLVDMHDDIVLHHGPNMWCLDCHSAEHRDELHLVDGELIPFSKSYLLCGQCHGDKLRDWKVGVHGKRIGMWNGQKQYFLCVNCHNPHSPHFKALKPLPPPIPPSEIRPPEGGKP